MLFYWSVVLIFQCGFSANPEQWFLTKKNWKKNTPNLWEKWQSNGERANEQASDYCSGWLFSLGWLRILGARLFHSLTLYPSFSLVHFATVKSFAIFWDLFNGDLAEGRKRIPLRWICNFFHVLYYKMRWMNGVCVCVLSVWDLRIGLIRSVKSKKMSDGKTIGNSEALKTTWNWR